ncbi:MAG: 23S rRNA (guanosine(2251)-2'-O)-methyltransferase RlmB [Gammaproteobacteria bacterium]|nr:23S rRNA (guanosine(2251)-2'-O)-methyltransferase RlmB [Gammaproteobacteria bacterium]
MKKSQYIYGIHAVKSLLDKNPSRIMRLHVAKERMDQKIQSLIDLAEAAHIPIELTTRNALTQLTHSDRHQGVMASCHRSKSFSENDLADMIAALSGPVLFLILDGVQDPHNLGACLRTADALGVHAVIAPRDRSVGLTETVAKVASGAAETVPFIQVTNLSRTLSFLKENNIWIYGADAEAAKTLYEENLTGSVALVMGAEGTGLRRLTRECCDGLLKIPMQGAVSSLNVSVATGIFLCEVVRQRLIISASRL